MERNEATLLDIVRAARLVLEFKAGMGQATFQRVSRESSADTMGSDCRYARPVDPRV